MTDLEHIMYDALLKIRNGLLYNPDHWEDKEMSVLILAQETIKCVNEIEKGDRAC